MKLLLPILGVTVATVGVSMVAFEVWIPGLFLIGLGCFACLMPLARRTA